MLNSATPDFAILVFAKLRYAVTGCFLALLYSARLCFAELYDTPLRYVGDINLYCTLLYLTLLRQTLLNLATLSSARMGYVFATLFFTRLSYT